LSAEGKRVELIDGDQDGAGVKSYIGLGLIGSLIIGFSPLRDAVVGNGPFEEAMMRFLACVAVSVGAATIIGRLIDAAPTAGQVSGAEPDLTGAGGATTGDLDPNPPIFDESADGGN
jgi:hypothetical protein